MSLLSGLFRKPKMDALELGSALKEAFRLGEAKDPASRKKAITLYQTIVKDYPDCFVAWFNSGVIQSRLGQWQAAVQSFAQAQKSPDLRVVAAYARLKLLVENGRAVQDDEFPEEFRGDKRGALGVQGPCYNAANELRNRGYDCVVEGEGESCSITSTVGPVKYTIAVNDLLGMLFKNVYREEGGQRVNLGDVKDLDDLDQEFTRLDVGRMGLVQAPVSGALGGVTYRRLREAALAKSGPHGWVRQGRSFDEIAAQSKAEAAQHGIEYVQILDIAHLAAGNWMPGTVFTCVLNGEPHAIAMLGQVQPEHLPIIKTMVAKGICLLRGEFFSMPQYPLVHIGLGIPVQVLEGTRLMITVLESAVNYVEANFQDWVSALESKGYTQIHVYGPDRSEIASGRLDVEEKIVAGIVDAVNQANSAFGKIPQTALDFNSAVTAFFEQHPEPFI